MPSVFSRIVAGEIPCHKIAETETCLAFLDVNPLKEGHTLVIPKAETDYFFDLPEETISELMVFSKQVARAIKHAIACKRVGITVIGLEVPHAHVHLIPINIVGDMNFEKQKLNPGTDQLKATAEKIRKHLSFPKGN